MVILKIIDHENNIEKEYDIHSLSQYSSEIIIRQWNDNGEEIIIRIPINKNDTIESIPKTYVLRRSE